MTLDEILSPVAGEQPQVADQVPAGVNGQPAPDAALGADLESKLVDSFNKAESQGAAAQQQPTASSAPEVQATTPEQVQNAAQAATPQQPSSEPEAKVADEDEVKGFFESSSREIEMPPEKKKGFFSRFRQ